MSSDPWYSGRRPTLHPSSIGGFLADLNDQPWADGALCAQTDPEAFFPDKGVIPRSAKQICVCCDVRAECLAYALEHPELVGVWGGLAEVERRRIIRSRRRAQKEAS